MTNFSRRITVAAGALAAVTLAPLPGGSAPANYLELASGRVNYSLKGTIVNGSSVFTWDTHGRRFRQDVTVTLDTAAMMAAQGGGAAAPPPPAGAAQAAPMKSWAFLDGKHLYTHAGMMGKTVNRMTADEKRIKSMIQGVPGVAGGVGDGKIVGKAKVLGKTCEVREVGSLKISSWKKIPLKVEIGQKGTPTYLTMQATKLTERASIAAAQLQVPAGYKVVDQQAPRMGAPAAPPAGR